MTKGIHIQQHYKSRQSKKQARHKRYPNIRQKLIYAICRISAVGNGVSRHSIRAYTPLFYAYPSSIVYQHHPCTPSDKRIIRPLGPIPARREDGSTRYSTVGVQTHDVRDHTRTAQRLDTHPGNVLLERVVHHHTLGVAAAVARGVDDRQVGCTYPSLHQSRQHTYPVVVAVEAGVQKAGCHG
jgi:hypothetical protein